MDGNEEEWRGRTANTNAFEPDMQEVLWDFKLVTIFPRKVRERLYRTNDIQGWLSELRGLS